MVESKVVFVAQARLNKATETVRGLARQLGVNYAPWPEVRQAMTTAELDPVDMADFLLAAEVKDTEIMLGVVRYRLEAEEAGHRIESATVVIHLESHTIEIITLRTKGDHHG